MQYKNLGNCIEAKAPSLKPFMDKNVNTPSLATLSSIMRLLLRHEFKNSRGEWISSVKPNLGPGISERVADALRTIDENIDLCYSLKNELRSALSDLLGATVPGPPPKLQIDPTTLKSFLAKAFSLLSVAGESLRYSQPGN